MLHVRSTTRNKDVLENLRKRADEYLKRSGAAVESPADEIGRLIQELETYQVELEMQNDELVRTRREAELALERYTDLYEHAPMGYVTLDEQGMVVRINEVARNALGWVRAVEEGTLPFSRHVLQQRKGRFYGLLNTRGPVRTGEAVLVRKDGAVFPALVEVADEKGRDGTSDGWRLAFMDISAQKEAETLLKEAQARTQKHATELAAEVAERKRAEKKLKEYAEQLELRNKELQEFAFVASHDLQEPLRKVCTFSDMVREGYSYRVLDEKGIDYLQRAQQAARRMHSLIKALLDYSRVTTRKGAIDLVDLNDVVNEVIEDLTIREGARVEVGELCTVLAEPTHMRRLFQNLITNGLKFQTRPDPVVKISGALLDENTNDNPLGAPACRISVEDNGIGFDEKFKERIFVPFQRLHGVGVYEGTGMGLAICRKIAEQHGGRITAHSKKDEGATFEVILPLGRTEE